MMQTVVRGQTESAHGCQSGAGPVGDRKLWGLLSMLVLLLVSAGTVRYMLPIWISAFQIPLLSDDYCLLVRAWPECLLPQSNLYHYFPGLEALYCLLKLLFGWNALPFQVISMAVYLTNIVLLWLFSNALFRSRLGATISCLAFISFPFSHEVLFWIITRLNYGMVLLCFLAGGLMVMRAGSRGFNAVSGITTVLVFALGLSFLEQMGAALPIWCLLWWHSRRMSTPTESNQKIRSAAMVSFAMLALCAAMGIVRVLYTSKLVIVPLSFSQKLCNFARMHLLCLRIDALQYQARGFVNRCVNVVFRRRPFSRFRLVPRPLS